MSAGALLADGLLERGLMLAAVAREVEREQAGDAPDEESIRRRKERADQLFETSRTLLEKYRAARNLTSGS